MREIKYRGLQRYTHKWVYGHYWCHEQVHRIQPQGYKDAFHEIDIETLGQYTGIKADGKEVYEGDIVKVYDEIGQIIFSHSYYTFNGAILGADELCSDNIEIIGNIHENPELLS